MSRPPIALHAASLAALPRVRHGFSTRLRLAASDPPDAGHEDRRALLAAATLAGARIVALRQVHEARIFDVRAATDGEVPPAGYDAAATARRGVALAIQTADCVPILYAAGDGGAVAGAHAGWRGTALGIAARVVEHLAAAYGCAPGTLRVAIGPAIGPCCFEVGEEVVEGLRAQAPRTDDWLVAWPGRKPHVDLAAVNRAILADAGVPPAAIETVPGCTRCDAVRFHSYRREGAGAGRQLSIVGLAG